MDCVVGAVSSDIARYQSPSGDSALVAAVADSQLYATRDSCDAVIYFIGPGNMCADPLRSQISGCELPWEVTYLVAYSILPFGNDLITMTLTGRQIKDRLEQQFDNLDPGKNRVLQISQVFSYAWSKRAEGGDKFSIFENGAQRTDGGSDLEAFVAYLKEHPLISLRLGDRISLSP